MPEYDPGHSKGAGAQQNMGWLRELMLSANPPYKSYGQLARAALAHSDWPEHTRTQARSLASVLSKLDRQVDVQWLADRESVQRILAELLSCSFADVRSAVERQLSGPSTTPRRLRLEDLRYARTLDLTDEPLCPGLPSLVLCPAMWGACWWHAPSGSGRSLTANWLAARGLTATVCARNWTEAQNRTPVHGAVFIELHGPDDTPVHLPPGLGPVCVAAPFAPTGSTSSWRIIQSPPVECYLDELVDWVDAQLGASSRFDASFAKRWLRDGPAAQRGLVDRLGAVLGLCGLIDELGPRQLRGRSLHELSRRFFELRMAEAVEPTDAAWFKGTGYPVLLGMFKRLLTDGNAPWHEARTFDEWLHMVPLEHRQGADLDWMRLALLDGTTPVRAADIEPIAWCELCARHGCSCLTTVATDSSSARTGSATLWPQRPSGSWSKALRSSGARHCFAPTRQRQLRLRFKPGLDRAMPAPSSRCWNSSPTTARLRSRRSRPHFVALG
jgi:hypothetical protein